MQPKLEKIFSNLSSSITVKREVTPFMDYPWHYHPEFEIIYVEKSNGIRFMGNHIGNFYDGDLMFISSNLPHVWKNDMEYYGGNEELFVDVYVIHFREDALCKGFFDLPEFTHVKQLFTRGEQGVLITGEDHQEIANLVKSVVHASGIKRITLFMEVLDKIAHTKNYQLLSNPGYTNSVNTADTERINVIIDYIMKNYAKEIKLDVIADLANLTIPSFCRYFKSRTNKTCSQFINEIRILNACKLLTSSDNTIGQISYEVGYNNLSHFNRQFKLITGLTAKTYAKKYLEELN